MSKEVYAQHEKTKQIIEYFQKFSLIPKTRKTEHSTNINTEIKDYLEIKTLQNASLSYG
jgi:hypothetical protein